ncbi:hypothetical protein [Bifidobacterium thermophilum]|uniref:hypothetical protein n=1 Tax=Bifidobacterium thermophilum TaxID=33905 RepID=UPI003F8E55D0
MSRHKKGSIIIRPLTVREVDTTGLEPQIVLLRSGVFDLEDITVLEESGALQQLVDVGVFGDQRILNLFYQLILQPPSRTDMEGEEHRERRLAASRAWWVRNKEEKNRERREQYPSEMRGRAGTARIQPEATQSMVRPASGTPTRGPTPVP